MHNTKNNEKETAANSQKPCSKKEALIVWVGKKIFWHIALHIAKELCPFANIAEVVTFIKEYFSNWFDFIKEYFSDWFD